MTISRRGTSLVIANMLLNTATNTKIGMALSAIASGVTTSFSTRNRLRMKLIATPSTVPIRRPMNAFVPDTFTASQMWPRLSVNSSKMREGGARK